MAMLELIGSEYIKKVKKKAKDAKKPAAK